MHVFGRCHALKSTRGRRHESHGFHLGRRRSRAGRTPRRGGSEKRPPPLAGFNLLYFFQARFQEGPVEIPEDDFVMIRDLGFDFVRIPMDYWYWIASGWRSSGRPAAADVVKIEERAFAPIDRVVELGRKHGLHVSLNFHRASGYCINGSELEPFALWRDQAAEDPPRPGFMPARTTGA